MISFKYLGQVLITSGNDYMAVVANIMMSQWKWLRLSRILGWEGADPRTSGTLYKTVVQENLFLGPETWVKTLRIRRTIVRFYHRLACCSAGIHLKQGTSRRWEYPYLEEVMANVGLEEMETYSLNL